ncbi:hypothetical protein GGR56DRAFT_616032 [Xylariaceae sp. FL0804]|nr:hypothetical protein GGR56DRAFT_616032 [Xylariaceae sp. FL0804]
MSPMSLDQIGSLPPALQQAILDGPALAPPPGVAPDFAHPPNGNAKTLAIASLCLGLTTFAVMVRVYARFFRMKNALFQDYLAIAAYGLYLAYSYTMFWQVYTHGFFLHQWDIQVRDLAGVFRMSIVAANLYAVVIMVMKACILMDWSALFVPRGTRNGFWWTCHIFMALNVLFYTTVIAVANASCTPYRRLWDKTVPGSKCLDITLIYLVSAAINVVLDLVTLVLPQKVIWTLHMTTKRKISVSCIFVVGVLYVDLDGGDLNPPHSSPFPPRDHRPS